MPLVMREMPLHNICLRMQGSRPTIRLLTGKLVIYHGENTLLASVKTHSQIIVVVVVLRAEWATKPKSLRA
jgi:hypothetical protein